MSVLDSKIPKGPLKDKWTNHKNKIDLVNPANKRNIDVIVVGTGLAGVLHRSLAEMGYNVSFFVIRILQEELIHRSQGDKCSKNYQNDGDSFIGCFMTR